MNIYLQTTDLLNPQVFWSTFGSPIATLVGVIITGSVAYFLFNKGIAKERRLYQERHDNEKKDEKIKELDQLQKFGKLFTTLLNNCINVSQKQLDNYKEFAVNCLADPLGQHFVKEVSMENLKRLLSFDLSDILLFHEYKGLKNIDFIETISRLDFLNEVFKRIPEDIHENNGKTVIELTNKLIEIRTKILSKCAEFLNFESEHNTAFASNPLWSTINTLVINYYENNDGRPSAKWDFENLITPIKNQLLVDAFRHNKLCNELLGLAKTGGDIIFSIKDFTEDLCNGILLVTESIDSTLNKLRPTFEKLNYFPNQGNTQSIT